MVHEHGDRLVPFSSSPCFLASFLLAVGVRLRAFFIWVDRHQGSLLPCACVFQWGSKIGKQIYNNIWMHWIRKDSFGAMTSSYFPSDAHSTEICHRCVLELYVLWKLTHPLSCVCYCCSFFFFLSFCLFLLWIRNILLRYLLWRCISSF